MLGEVSQADHHASSAIQAVFIHQHHAEAASRAQERLVAKDPIFRDRVVLVDGVLFHKE